MAKRNGHNDPVENYIEWSRNTLNPGHYLGGTIPPDLRKGSLGPRARRLSGVALTISGLAGLVIMAVAMTGEPDSPAWARIVMLPAVAVGVLTLAAGIAMLRSASRRKPKSRRYPTRRTDR